MSGNQNPTRLQVVARVVASLVGSYAFVWGLGALGISIAVAGGMPYGDAQTLLYLLAFVAYVACFCWAFAAQSLRLVWGVLVGGGAAMTGVAWLLARAIA